MLERPAPAETPEHQESKELAALLLKLDHQYPSLGRAGASPTQVMSIEIFRLFIFILGRVCYDQSRAQTPPSRRERGLVNIDTINPWARERNLSVPIRLQLYMTRQPQRHCLLYWQVIKAGMGNKNGTKRNETKRVKSRHRIMRSISTGKLILCTKTSLVSYLVKIYIDCGILSPNTSMASYCSLFGTESQI